MGLAVWVFSASRTGPVLKKTVPDFRNGHRALMLTILDWTDFTQITVLCDGFDIVVLSASRTGSVL